MKSNVKKKYVLYVVHMYFYKYHIVYITYSGGRHKRKPLAGMRVISAYVCLMQIVLFFTLVSCKIRAT